MQLREEPSVCHLLCTVAAVAVLAATLFQAPVGKGIVAGWGLLREAARVRDLVQQGQYWLVAERGCYMAQHVFCIALLFYISPVLHPTFLVLQLALSLRSAQVSFSENQQIKGCEHTIKFVIRGCQFVSKMRPAPMQYFLDIGILFSSVPAVGK
jgi:hypothetical protein